MITIVMATGLTTVTAPETTQAAQMTHDALSLSMFLAGALMAFLPLICAGIVLTVWWRQRVRTRGAAPGTDDVAPPVDP